MLYLPRKGVDNVTRKCRAVYEEGVFRPLEPVKGLREFLEVELVVAPIKKQYPLAAFAGCWQVKEADEALALIEREFESIDPREW